MRYSLTLYRCLYVSQRCCAWEPSLQAEAEAAFRDLVKARECTDHRVPPTSLDFADVERDKYHYIVSRSLRPMHRSKLSAARMLQYVYLADVWRVRWPRGIMERGTGPPETHVHATG